MCVRSLLLAALIALFDGSKLRCVRNAIQISARISVNIEIIELIKKYRLFSVIIYFFDRSL